MRVRISYVVELTEEVRKGLENHYGRRFRTLHDAAGTLRSFCRGNGEGALDDLTIELDMAEEWQAGKDAQS